MSVTNERLQEIAETAFEDPEDLILAINELAAVVLELRQRPVAAPEPTPAAPQLLGRMIGRPVPPQCRQIQCPKCYADVVVFKGKKSGKEYLCDAEMGYAGNVRTMLTAPNWFHECGGKR